MIQDFSPPFPWPAPPRRRRPSPAAARQRRARRPGAGPARSWWPRSPGPVPGAGKTRGKHGKTRGNLGKTWKKHGENGDFVGEKVRWNTMDFNGDFWWISTATQRGFFGVIYWLKMGFFSIEFGKLMVERTKMESFQLDKHLFDVFLSLINVTEYWTWVQNTRQKIGVQLENPWADWLYQPPECG